MTKVEAKVLNFQLYKVSVISPKKVRSLLYYYHRYVPQYITNDNRSMTIQLLTNTTQAIPDSQCDEILTSVKIVHEKGE